MSCHSGPGSQMFQGQISSLTLVEGHLKHPRLLKESTDPRNVLLLVLLIKSEVPQESTRL